MLLDRSSDEDGKVHETLMVVCGFPSGDYLLYVGKDARYQLDIENNVCDERASWKQEVCKSAIGLVVAFLKAMTSLPRESLRSRSIGPILAITDADCANGATLGDVSYVAVYNRFLRRYLNIRFSRMQPILIELHLVIPGIRPCLVNYYPSPLALEIWPMVHEQVK